MTMIEAVALRHEEQRAIDSADQVELQAILSGSAVTGVGIRDEQISGEADDLVINEPEGGFFAEGEGFGGAPFGMIRFEREDVVLDEQVGGVRDEIIRRITLMGAAYPFTLNENLLQYNPSPSGFYEYCLGICFAPSVTKKPYVNLPRSFERLTALIVQKHLGPKWRNFHIGWPRERANGSTFLLAADKLSQVSSDRREWVYDPAANFGIPPKRGGDEGMDFVVWRPSLDARIGQIFVVGQCACGRDWDTKFEDLTLKRLGSYFRPPTHVEIVRTFATPFMVSPGNFLVAHRDAGWTLDRARLALMAHDVVADPDYAALVPDIRDLYALSQTPLKKDVPAAAVAA